jgi:rhodanese-related sulfurtransferase
MGSTSLSPRELIAAIGTPSCPPIFDVRRRAVYDEADTVIPTARWRDAMAAQAWGLAPGSAAVVYCAHGHNVSQLAVALLRQGGVDARHLDGGIDGYVDAGGITMTKTAHVDPAAETPSRWVTRERPKIDRIACPWLIRRFIDRDAAFHFVEPEWVADIAAELGGLPYDIDGVALSHRGEECTFDTLIAEFGLDHAPLARLARIVRGADTARLDLEPEAAGLLAVSLGLSAIHDDDLVQLEAGLGVYDALYGWCRHAAGETHNWPSQPAA